MQLHMKILKLGKYLQGTFWPSCSPWWSDTPSAAHPEADGAIWDPLRHLS